MRQKVIQNAIEIIPDLEEAKTQSAKALELDGKSIDALMLRGVVALTPPMDVVQALGEPVPIVQLARDYLEHAGFEVLTAADGAEAIARFDAVIERRARREPVAVRRSAATGTTESASGGPAGLKLLAHRV